MYVAFYVRVFFLAKGRQDEMRATHDALLNMRWMDLSLWEKVRRQWQKLSDAEWERFGPKADFSQPLGPVDEGGTTPTPRAKHAFSTWIQFHGRVRLPHRLLRPPFSTEGLKSLQGLMECGASLDGAGQEDERLRHKGFGTPSGLRTRLPLESLSIRR